MRECIFGKQKIEIISENNVAVHLCDRIEYRFMFSAQRIVSCLHFSAIATRVARFFSAHYTKAAKIYLMTSKLPNAHKIYPIVVKYYK
jgi:hypothetical protein